MPGFVSEPIAIVGYSCRFPGEASTPSKLWDLLKDPRDVLKEIPATRFNPKGFYHPDGEYHGSTNVKHAYILDEDHRVFDNEFFGITPKEAESMDPQQRMLLETVYEGIETAGYSLEQLRGSPTAVFVGMMNSDYTHILFGDPDNLPPYTASGIALSIMANRVSYFFDWKGPSVVIDTACSSSMVALHQAVQALRNGEAEVAVAAGTNLILGPEMFIAESKLHMLSPTGGSRMWDASVDGYTRGEGLVSLILKPLSRAIADNDSVRCIIRETGVNQDGRTLGLTVPSATAQAELIRATYGKCGLDLTKATDRPQYFEAHGTGTPAGDPIEAEAIQHVFYPTGSNYTGDEKLLVGSIKTVIGHLEGSAGLAGVLKSVLAIQQGFVPPNLHFNRLNPKVEPFYDHLCVPRRITPWPSLPPNAPRRVSVNSFGFGGTNAHVILESWQLDSHMRDRDDYSAGIFVLSAASAQGLASMGIELGSYLERYPKTNLNDLSYTLSRRSQFNFRASFSATSTAQLVHKLASATLAKTSRVPTILETLPPRILAVFTGQGAQWPTMGRELYLGSALFRSRIDILQNSLDALPDPPDWTLAEQLISSSNTSRVLQAGVSQPLCTAIQVALVDLLRYIGISFSAAVGHSSGEIGAAYAAGYIDAGDAVRIAYYRGVFAYLARGPEGQKGKMLAVGMSFEQAASFCRELGVGRLRVAASNSQLSCTLSGDADAIDEAKGRLESQGTFARLLMVDTAYHSHHMDPCADLYLEALLRCNIKVQGGLKQCEWYSSMYGADGRRHSLASNNQLNAQYWVDNMTQPVLFSQAVQRAMTEENCHDLVLEIGPHPALKGPVSNIIKALIPRSLPYSGVLSRGRDALETFADAVGFVWERFSCSKSLVNLNAVSDIFSKNDSPAQAVLIEDLPSYCWDHERIFWKESRKSKAFRTRCQPIHELLGHATSLGEPQNREVRWRQIFNLNEMSWAKGHMFQSQVLFPATGYVSMAYEASVRLLDESQSLQLLELQELKFHRAMTLDENSAGVDVIFRINVTHHSSEYIKAKFACYSGPVDAGDQELQTDDRLNFSGQARLNLGKTTSHALPPRVEPTLPMDHLDSSKLYQSYSCLGLDYSGDFRIDTIRRRYNEATITTRRPQSLPSLRIHPGSLDAAFHSLLAAFSYPGDGRLWTAYLPTYIKCIRINMACPGDGHGYAAGLMIADCTVIEGDARVIVGDLDMFCASDGHPEIQMQGAALTALETSGRKFYRNLYAENSWVRDAMYGLEPSQRVVLSESRKQLGSQIERCAFFYLRKVQEIGADELKSMSWNHRHLINWVLEHLIPEVEAGKHVSIKKEWVDDTAELMDAWRIMHPRQIDLQLVDAVGVNLLAILRGTVPALQVMMEDNMLDKLYTEGLGCFEANQDIAVLVGQLAHQYPHMKILEIGAGTGGATHGILAALQGRFTSYTYTDISPGFFERAREIFKKDSHHMNFKTLNIEIDISEQGFDNGAFDLVIASNVLHATRRLEDTMRNCRRFLRPGGHLLLLEITHDYVPAQLTMGTLPGWFLGIDDGRVWKPTVSVEQWDSILKATGFSGVDTSVTSLFSVMMSQAVDDSIMLLRDPLCVVPVGLPEPMLSLSNLLIISADDGLASKVMKLLNPKFQEVAMISALEDIKEKKHEVFPGTAVCLFDLGTPSFHDMPERRYESLQEIVRNAGALFWVTRGAVNGSEPFASMAVGWGRSVQIESPGIKIQFLDFDCAHAVDAALLSTMLLRLALADHCNDPKVLWSFEPELAMVDGAIYIPRVRQNFVLDQRLNSGREVITQAVKLPANHLPIEICFYNGTMELHESLPSTHSDESVQMQTLASSACKISSSDGQSNFWCLGRDPASGDKALILSRTSASITNALKSDIFRWVEDGSGDDCLQFHRLLVSLIAASTLSGVTNQVWVHGADPELTLALKSASQKRNIDIFFTTCTAKIASDGTHFIHPYITERNLRKICPTNIQTFVNMESASNRDLNSLLLACLPVCTVVRSGPQIMPQNQPSVSVLYDHATLCNFIRNYSQEIEARYPSNPTVAPTPLDPNGRIVSVSQASNLAAADLEPTTTISWGNTETVEQRIRPVQHNSLFSEKKSYVLIGLTGDLGQSICLWMVEAGARYIVVCSRNPHFSPAVVEQISQRGAVLRIASVDISCRDSLRDLHANITTTMPPVGGVMNAAMVLRDRLFVNTSLTDFEAVIKPKVQGSQNLDHLFGAESNLDFFIMFSSLTCIIGNAGQAAYSAANTFMTGLVEQRRRRGLPASIVHIAMMMGLGYVHRASEEIEAGLRHKVMTLAESDLHEMLAEAIFCGNPRSNLSGELITGLKTGDTALWKENPRLWNFLRNDDGLVAEEGGQVYKRSQRIHNVETLLAEATTESMALTILEDNFVHLLGNILQIEPDKLDKETPVSSLGIDSLVAVQIRAWFLKEVGVEVPVLEVLGNNSLTQLCKNVLAGRRHNRQQDQELTSRESLRATVATEDVEWDNELDSLATEMRTLTAVNPPQLHETNGMGRCIVLTGATGVLGTHILRDLIADDRVQEVHCIAVRPRSNGADHSINQHHSKIFEHPGDLTESRLGLSPATFASLAKHADAILHVGVDNNIAKSYSELRSANVKSTQQLLAMASVCGVPVHYVSASAIATFQDGDSELPEISTSHLRPPRNIDDFNFMGLTATKWASEVLLERARGEVPVTIHRCVHMFGDSTPDSSILSAIDTYSRQLRAVPTLEMCLKGAFDLVEVAEVAAQIVAAALRSEIASKNDFVVINHCGKRKFRVQDIQQYYSEETGQIIESWTLEKWLERAEESGLKKSVASVLRQAVRSKQVLPMGSLRRGAV